MKYQQRNKKKCQNLFYQEPPCSRIRAPSPRWRSLCWGCRLGVSVFAAAGRDALLSSSGSSRDRRMSRGGPGTAIVLYAESPAGTRPTLFIPGSEHRQMHIRRHAYGANTQRRTSRDNEPRRNKGRALDCSPVAIRLPLLLRKRAFWGVPSALSHTAHIVCSQSTDMRDGQRKHRTVHTNKPPCHVTQERSSTVTRKSPWAPMSQISAIVPPLLWPCLKSRVRQTDVSFWDVLVSPFC